MKQFLMILSMLAVASASTANDRAAMYIGALKNMEKTHAVIRAMQVPVESCLAQIETGAAVADTPACQVFRRLSNDSLEQTRLAMKELQAACDNMRSLYDDPELTERCRNLADDSNAFFADLDAIRHLDSE
ncbi:MAG: hypothetical protein PVJ65_01855 [Chromatiales bacterium]|jgi:hypothetical protein